MEQQKNELEQLRGMVERQRSEKFLLATKGSAHFASAIQNSFRALIARRRLARARFYAIVIETGVRGMLARRSFRAAIHATIALQALARQTATRRIFLAWLKASQAWHIKLGHRVRRGSVKLSRDHWRHVWNTHRDRATTIGLSGAAERLLAENERLGVALAAAERAAADARAEADAQNASRLQLARRLQLEREAAKAEATAAHAAAALAAADAASRARAEREKHADVLASACAEATQLRAACADVLASARAEATRLRAELEERDERDDASLEKFTKVRWLRCRCC